MNAPFPSSGVRAPKGCVEAQDTAWWNSRGAALLLIIAAVIPLLYPAVPPLVDLPGHMGRYRVEIDLATSPELQRHYTFQWSLIGNLGIDLLVIPLAKLIGLEPATKLLVAAIPPLTVAGFLAVAREVHGRVPALALFALPLAYNHPFLFGFVNYSLSMALAFLGFALWLRMGRRGQFRARAVLFVPISIALFVVHAFGWASLGVLAFSAEIVRHWNGGRTAPRALLLAVRDCLPLALPAVLMLLWRSGGEGPSFERWFEWRFKVIWLMTVFRENRRELEILAAFLLVGLLVAARLPLRARIKPVLGVATGLFAVTFLLLPWKVFGSAYADMRLAPYLLASAFLMFDLRQPAGRAARILAPMALCLYAAHLAVRTVDFARIADDQERQLEALSHVPRGARVATLVGGPCSDTWALPFNAHLGSFTIIRRHGFSNDQWVVPGMNLLSLRDPSIGKWGRDPSQVVLPRACATDKNPAVEDALGELPRERFDYLWLIDVQPREARLLEGWLPVWRSGESALLRRR